VLPERVQADSGAPVWTAVFSGERPRTHEPFGSIVFLNGGVGARSEHDGVSALAFPTNVSATPIEVHEHLAPLLFECKELVVDSGGAGRRRGGLGQRVRIRSLAERPITISLLTDRIEHAPEGTLGGAPGRPGAIFHSRLPWVDPKGQHVLLPGDVLTLETPGGGGHGDPAERDESAVARDLREGKVSPERSTRCRAAGVPAADDA